MYIIYYNSICYKEELGCCIVSGLLCFASYMLHTPTPLEQALYPPEYQPLFSYPTFYTFEEMYQIVFGLIVDGFYIISWFLNSVYYLLQFDRLLGDTGRMYVWTQQCTLSHPNFLLRGAGVITTNT